MKYRALALAALFPLSMIAACNNNDDNNGTTTPPVTDATVRFVNATGTSFDVASNGTRSTPPRRG